MKTQRIVVGISGSSGAILGIRLLQALQSTGIETHLVITPSARLTIEQETEWPLDDVLALASDFYNPRDLAAPIASGSFDTMGMIVAPCSIKSLSSIANSYTTDLLSRAADVNLKEGRPVLLAVRETPLHAGHMRLMSLAARAGAILFPPVPAFYTRPQSLDEVVDNLVGRMLRRIGIENNLYHPWQGLHKSAAARDAIVEKEDAPAGTGIRALPEEIASADMWSVPAMTLATVGPGGAPHAAPVYFAAGEEERGTLSLYFFTEAGSQHAQDLSANPQAAAAIYPQAQGWQEIRGLQLRGEVQPLPPGDAWEKAWSIYLVKFPFVSEFKDVITRSTLYAFYPRWIRLVDNRQGFGTKQEWTA